MATGNAFPLEGFEAAVQGDAELIGVVYTGSLGAGTADRYSDLDIYLWVTDEAFAAAPDTLQRVMTYLGPIQFLYRRGEAGLTGFVGPDWQRVDLVLHRRGIPPSSLQTERVRVIKDSDGGLARQVARSAAAPVAATWAEARAAVEEAIDSQLYLALHNARGAIWSAMEEVTYRAAALYSLLAQLRGYRSYGFRAVETLLSPAEYNQLADVWPSGPAREEVRRAARALWSWTRHVWAEVEDGLGRSLDLRVDEASLLAAVDRIYA